MLLLNIDILKASPDITPIHGAVAHGQQLHVPKDVVDHFLKRIHLHKHYFELFTRKELEDAAIVDSAFKAANATFGHLEVLTTVSAQASACGNFLTGIEKIVAEHYAKFPDASLVLTVDRLVENDFEALATSTYALQVGRTEPFSEFQCKKCEPAFRDFPKVKQDDDLNEYYEIARSMCNGKFQSKTTNARDNFKSFISGFSTEFNTDNFRREIPFKPNDLREVYNFIQCSFYCIVHGGALPSDKDFYLEKLNDLKMRLLKV